MPPETTQFRNADRMAEGRLVEIITDHRAQGLSYEAIARRLLTTFGIELSGKTLRRWGRDLGLDAKETETKEAVG